MELNEWKYMNPPTASNSSGSYKKRFEKLINYHINHASSELESITKKDIRDDYFHLGEHYNDGKSEFDRDIIASYDKASGTFFFRIFVDGKEKESILRKGYEDFVRAVEAYMYLPDSRTSEYNNLLVEWLDSKGSKINLNNSPTHASSAQAADNKTPSDNYSLWKTFVDAVVDYIDSIPELSDLKTSQYSEGSTGVWKSLRIYDNLPEGHYIKIRFNTETEEFEITTEYEDFNTVRGHGFNLLMSTLNDIAFTIFELGGFDFLGLRESFSSIAEEFKTYDNLWD